VAERAGTAQPGEEKAQGHLSMCINTNRMEWRRWSHTLLCGALWWNKRELVED